MTYTVAATQEMRARFAARFGGELAARLEFRTINGVAARIIALYSRMYGRTPPELIRNESETTPLLMRLWQDTNHEYPAESTVKDLRTAITYIKNMCLTDAELDELETYIENLPDLYRGYQKALKAAHKMDYDDQLCFALQNHVVRHQSTGVHKAFCLFAHRGAVLDGGTQNVAGGNGRDAQLIAEDLCLSSLAGAGGAQKDQFHRTFPFSYSKNPLW